MISPSAFIWTLYTLYPSVFYKFTIIISDSAFPGTQYTYVCIYANVDIQAPNGVSRMNQSYDISFIFFIPLVKKDLWRVTNDLSKNDSSANKSVLCEFILPKKKDRATREHFNTNIFIHIYIFLRVKRKNDEFRTGEQAPLCQIRRTFEFRGRNIYFSNTRNLICTSLRAQLINRSHELRSCMIGLFDGDDFGIRKRNYILWCVYN